MVQESNGFRIVTDHIKHLVRGSTICTVIFFILYPWYNAAYDTLSAYSFMNDARIFTLGMSTVHMVVYWTMNSFFLFCDKYGYLEQYKIPRLPSQQVSDELLHKTLTKAIFGQVMFEPVSTIYILFPLFQLHGTKMRYSDEDTPKFLYVLGTMVLAEVAMEWLFYAFHRLLHIPMLYGLIHKQHHEYKGSIGFAAEWAHPVESLLANFYPTLAGCLHTGAHPLVFYVYLGYRLWNTYEGHSGYSFRGTFLHKYFGLTFGDTALYHDYHHTRNTGNYGGHIQDWLFGTDTGYHKWLDEWDRANMKRSKDC